MKRRIVLLAAVVFMVTGNRQGQSAPVSWSGPCNRPPVYYPDGCPDIVRVGPPVDSPIPSACIVEAYTEPDFEHYDQWTIRLVIVVEHPERPGAMPDRLYFFREPANGSTTLHAPHWDFYQTDDWDAACGADEAPLAWAVDRLLQGDLGAMEIYTAPLPAWFLEMIAELGGWQLYRVFLPVVGGRYPLTNSG